MKRTPQFETEADLAGAFHAHLETLGWDCYPEAAVNRGGNRADLIAYRKPLVWVIEAKLSFNEAVCYQALAWLGYAHFVSVLVPYATSQRAVLRQWCEWKGIGIVTARRRDPFRGESEIEFEIPIQHRLHRAVFQNGRWISDRLHPDMKRFAAGTNGAFSSPWRRTMEAAVGTIRNNPGCSAKQIAHAITHHYHYDATARACLAQWLQKDPRVRCVHAGRALRFWIAGAEPKNEQGVLEVGAA